MHRKRSLVAFATLLVAGCGLPPAPGDLPVEVAQTAPQPTPRVWTRPDMPQFPPRTPPGPRNPPGPQASPGSQGTDDLFVYCTGQARDNRRDVWAFSMDATQTPGGVVTGRLLFVSSIHNITLFGTITGGTVTRNATGGGGAAQLTGVLTTGETISIQVTDRNSATNRDSFAFQVPTGPSFSGTVTFDDICIMRCRPLARGQLKEAGYLFDPRMGLFMDEEDLLGETIPPSMPIDKRAIEVTRPDPKINFRKNDAGGLVDSPGGTNNRP
jgi:hypothetical protein